MAGWLRISRAMARARMGLLVHGATRWNGRNAARRMLPRQSRRAVDERLLLNGLLLNGRLPAANEGVRWGASYARSAAGSAAAGALRDNPCAVSYTHLTLPTSDLV